MGCGLVAGRAVLGDTAVHLPGRTWGHRTHQTTILFEVSLSFSLSLQVFLYALFFDITQQRHGMENDAGNRRSFFFFNVCASVEHVHMVG